VNLYCDHYATCHSVIWDQGSEDQTRAVARAKGWHLFDGFSLEGKKLDVVLCRRHVDGRRRDLPPAPSVLDGQIELF
jgi:hypothetical protein